MDVKKLPKELFGILTKVAPLLGTALGGSAGTLVGTLIANVFGADPKDYSDILTKILGDPDRNIKLQQLEMTHEETLKKLNNDRYAAEIDDRKSAREHNAKMNDWVVHLIAVGYSGLFALIFTLMAFQYIEIDNSLFINIFSIAMIIVNYYFGSSNKK